jgi:hypothetical protein
MIGRKQLRDAIRIRYPKLDGDIKDGGMANLIKDVVIDIDVLDDCVQDDELPISSGGLVAEDSDEDKQRAYTSAEVGLLSHSFESTHRSKPDRFYF